MLGFSRLLLALSCAALLQTAAVASAQQTGTAVSTGLKTDTSAPIEVDADQLSVDQETGVAVFSGNVRITQAELRVTAPKATLLYLPDRSAIDTVTLIGGVTLTNGAEVVRGDEAVYTVSTGVVVITGDVVVTQGPSTIAGPRLTYNLDSGEGLMDGGRVQTVFQPGATGGAAAQ